MAEPRDLLVVNVPGLSARMLKAHEDRLPVIRRLAEKGQSATVVVLDSASPEQLEAAMVTGMLPEYLGAMGTGAGESRSQPFWERARRQRPELKASVKLTRALPNGWASFAKGAPNLEWVVHDHIVEALEDKLPGLLHELDEYLRARENTPRAIALLSSWARRQGRPAPQDADPLDRPVLVTRGIEQPKTCIGICEIAGILERVLTGERISDAL